MVPPEIFCGNVGTIVDVTPDLDFRIELKDYILTVNPMLVNPVRVNQLTDRGVRLISDRGWQAPV